MPSIEEAVIEDLWFGLATPLEVMSPSADPKWLAEIPDDQLLGYDVDRANQILDDAGYLDTDGDGVREMPDGTNPMSSGTRSTPTVTSPTPSAICSRAGWRRSEST